MSRRVAAIDCGTNSIRLLIADIDGTAVTDVVREMRIVRLGEGVDRTSRLSAAALQRTFTALRDYAELTRRHAAERVRMVATSATRDAANRDEFVAGVRSILGVEPEVVSGDEEAMLSYAGATAELGDDPQVPAPYLVCDIGGGSAEFVLGDGGQVSAAVSVDVGCVRLTERHVHDDPPTPSQRAAAEADVAAALATAAGVVDLTSAGTLVGLAGSVTTVAGIALGLPHYDAAVIHRSRITASQVHEVTHRLWSLDRSARAALPVMHPGRVDVIAAGALILDAVVRATGVPSVLVSEHDILDGIALSVA